MAEGALDNAWLATVPINPEFAARYRERFKVSTSIGGAAVHFELYRILLEIGSRPVSADKIRTALLSINNRKSELGNLSVVRKHGDQWFDLPYSDVHNSLWNYEHHYS